MLGIGKSTVSIMLAGDPEGKVSEEMWREVEAKTKPASGSQGWNLVETGVYKEITQVMQDVQMEAGCTWIVADAGSGKSTTARHYTEMHPNAHYILCADMVRSEFLQEVGRCIGLKLVGSNLRRHLLEIVDRLTTEEAPILIFDEADKLTDGVFNYFVQFYNMLEDKCGLVFLSTASSVAMLSSTVAWGDASSKRSLSPPKMSMQYVGGMVSTMRRLWQVSYKMPPSTTTTSEG